MVAFLVLGMIICLGFQNCGPGLTGGGGDGGGDSSSSSAAPAASPAAKKLPQITVAITPVNGGNTSGVPISFSTNSLPTDATVAWSNAIQGSSSSTNGVCGQKSATNTDGNYAVLCALGGNLIINVEVIEQGQITGHATFSQAITYVPTPTPLPPGAATPTPDPETAAGMALYSTNCQSCHFPIAVSDRQYTSSAQVNAAIANGGIAAMQGQNLKTLTTTTQTVNGTTYNDIDLITYALSHP